MSTLRFRLQLHTPIRVGAAYARDGVDAAIDHDEPLPADHLKGVMRDAAVRLLRQHHPAVVAVFGSHRHPSPWAWMSATSDHEWRFGLRHRVGIDDVTGAATKDLLVLGEQAWVDGASFEVAQFRRLPVGGDVGRYSLDDHLTVLRVAAGGMHALGSWRRRGLGWVGLTPVDVDGLDAPVTDREVRQVLAWRADAPAGAASAAQAEASR